MVAAISYCLAAWATGYVLGNQVRMIREALSAA